MLPSRNPKQLLHLAAVLSRAELPLEGWTLAMSGARTPAARHCARHLIRLGALEAPGTRATPGITLSSGEKLTLVGPHEYALDASIRWSLGAVASYSNAWPEIALQATSGLMAVHGLDTGPPRRLGLDIVSTAAGTLACTAMLAGLLARGRGLPVDAVQTYAAGAAMLMLGHHLASATCGDSWTPPVGGTGPGPPFPTADGEWVELEVLEPERWGAFWRRLGVRSDELGPTWLAFAFRHNTARCHLAPALHAATARRSLAELRAAASACGVALVRLRDYDEVLADWTREHGPWTFHLLGDVDSRSATTTVSRSDATRSGPLAGVRVVEVTSRIQGPMAGRVLAMLGADVTRVEPPGGDPARDAPPTAGDVGAAFVTYNQGKRAVELDYKTRSGRADLLELVRGADVFLHNWRPRRADEIALTAGDLARVRKDIVYAHASGWGSGTGPALARLATDFLVQAHAGCGAGLYPVGEPPFPSRLTIVDVLGGLVAAEAIVGGLLVREHSRQACSVETSLFSSALEMQDTVLAGLASGDEQNRAHGRPIWGPLDRPMATADGYIVVDARDPAAQRRFARLCGARDESAQPSSASLQAEFTAEWIERLRAVDICAAPVRSDLAEVACDPQYAAVTEQLNVCSVAAAPWCFEVGGG